MNIKKTSALAVVGATAFTGLIGGLGINALAANAATPTTTLPATSSAADPADSSTKDESKGGHVGANGVTEAVLTGDAATKALAAAQTAVPGATVLRAENDAEGATYEVHMQKADGTRVTVKLDAGFKVTGTETGFGGHGAQNGDTNTN